jgi:hypothetical protein
MVPTTKQRRAQSLRDKARNNSVGRSRQFPPGMPKQIKGKGNYFTDAMRRIFNPGDFGKAGNWAGNALSKVVGFGDYTIKKNSIVESMPRDEEGKISKAFSFSDTGTSTIRVKKREYLGAIVSPASGQTENFTQLQYRIQPTDRNSFPWLASIAGLYTEWCLKGCIYSFESTSSNYSSSVGLGTIAMATQYNSNMLPYSSMESVLQSAYHTRGNPSEDLIHGVECDPKLQASDRLFTRRPGSEGPPNLYDHGVLTVATEGLPEGSFGVTLGRIYVTYDVELSLPELPVTAPFMDRFAISQNLAVGAASPFFGDTLALQENTISEVTFSSSETTEGVGVLLLGSSSGPLVKPSLTPQQESQLMGWMSDSTIDATTQWLSFSRAGTYMITGIGARAGGTPFTADDLVIAAHDATIVTNVGFINSLSQTDHGSEWLYRVAVTTAGGSISMTNNDSEAHAAWLQITYCPS